MIKNQRATVLIIILMTLCVGICDQKLTKYEKLSLKAL